MMDQMIGNYEDTQRFLEDRSFDDRDDDTNILVHFYDPREHELPSQRFNIWMFVGVFFAVIFASGVLVYMIISASRVQESTKAKAEESKSKQSCQCSKDILKINAI